MSSEDAYVSTREAADLLGISLRTAQLWVESGVLLAWKTSGGHRRILRQSVDALLAERARQSGTSVKKSAANDALKVVVVEDDQDLLRLIELSLSDLPSPTEVRSAKDGFAGLVLIGQFLPDLVIADLNMPGMDGFRMIQSLIGSEFAPTKIIASTALSPADIELKGGLPDSVEILQKPYSLDLLEEKVLGVIKK
ncbi:response regulator [Polynucleobacter paneuropaeus]|jgi:excisionase family DNA binding protein|uniref:Response regulator n=1 Tax=Polynucleobacter paneuropaeus TaxID=2527775 RepID=A0A9Q2WJL5_9BURK|nr:response regulator [Polynucleobacter paneuropaeus]MBT8532274.1 response regulator [Polynucleobacter paneuropaeus]MBT8552118.1 response regulator [Polynucleobacter paneuropaeus]MBT8593867.1 response regulator [Polynucleobacter paneuropaeus]MBT8602489.1 response regulator [Polynucleobacter paneuropaeus]